jgi:AcrR family transcriptional regulator
MATETVRRGRKFDQVMDGARQVFLRDGFEGASVDDIARAAGVSKATLYAYFPDKRLLFLEFAKAECRRQAEEGAAAVDTGRPAREVLTEAAFRIIRFMVSDFGMRVFRVCVAESARFPDLGAEFYVSGPAVVRAALESFLREAEARGELSIPDLGLAAEQFHELCKADIHDRVVFGMRDRIGEADIARTAHGAVDMFLARYGTGREPPRPA